MSDATKKFDRLIQVIELGSAILLAFATILGAFSAYVGSLWGGNSATNYTKAIITMSEANTDYLEAIQGFLEEEIEFGFQEIIDIHYNRELELGNEDFAENEILYRLNDVYQVYYKDNLTDEQIDNEVEKLAAERDKEIEKYIADSDAVYDEAMDLLEEGQQFNTNGDNFSMVTVYFAIAMFFAGFVNVVKKMNIKVAFICLGICMFVFSVIQMAVLPFPF